MRGDATRWRLIKMEGVRTAPQPDSPHVIYLNVHTLDLLALQTSQPTSFASFSNCGSACLFHGEAAFQRAIAAMQRERASPRAGLPMNPRPRPIATQRSPVPTSAASKRAEAPPRDASLRSRTAPGPTAPPSSHPPLSRRGVASIGHTRSRSSTSSAASTTATLRAETSWSASHTTLVVADEATQVEHKSNAPKPATSYWNAICQSLPSLKALPALSSSTEADSTAVGVDDNDGELGKAMKQYYKTKAKDAVSRRADVDLPAWLFNAKEIEAVRSELGLATQPSVAQAASQRAQERQAARQKANAERRAKAERDNDAGWDGEENAWVRPSMLSDIYESAAKVSSSYTPGKMAMTGAAARFAAMARG